MEQIPNLMRELDKLHARFVLLRDKLTVAAVRKVNQNRILRGQPKTTGVQILEGLTTNYVTKSDEISKMIRKILDAFAAKKQREFRLAPEEEVLTDGLIDDQHLNATTALDITQLIETATVGLPIPPYNIYLTVYIQQPTETRERRTKTAHITTRTELPDKLLALIRSVPIYAGHITQVTATIIRNPTTIPRIYKLADYTVENCVVSLLRTWAEQSNELIHKGRNQMTRQQAMAKIYTKFPQLTPTGGKVYIDDLTVRKLAAYLKAQISIYTPLTFMLDGIQGKPWFLSSKSHNPPLRMIIEKEHATTIPDNKVDSVAYTNEPIVPPDNPNVSFVATKEDQTGLIVQYYIQQKQTTGEVTKTYAEMTKSFRPSTYTQNPEDDQDPDYFYILSYEQLLAKQFMDQNDIIPVINPEIRSIILGAERFIGRSKLSPIKHNAVAIDHNRHYSCATTSPYFVGFPSNTLTVHTELPQRTLDVQPLHKLIPAYVIGRLITPPQEYTTFFAVTEKVFAYPEYKYLTDHGAKVEIDYVLMTDNFAQTDIYAWVRKQQLNMNDEKLFVNALIGRLITGGVKVEDTKIIEFSNAQERDRLIQECNERDLNMTIKFTDDDQVQEEQLPWFTDLGVKGYIKVKIPAKKFTGKYNFHAYLMSYASTSMYAKLRELTEHGHTLHAYNVDSLVVSHPKKRKSDYHDPPRKVNGGWKLEPVSEYYQNLSCKEIVRQTSDPAIIPIAAKYTENTAIIGAAGIAKTAPFLITPQHDQIIAFPTHKLLEVAQQECRTRSQLNRRMATHALLFRFDIEEDAIWLSMVRAGIVPKPGQTIVIDEFTMRTKDEIEIMIRRAHLVGAVAIFLGDPEQILADSSVSESSMKMTIVSLTRQEGTAARHSFEYGSELDLLRGLNFESQRLKIVELGIKYGKIITMEQYIADHATTPVIVYTHAEAFQYHAQLRNKVTITVRKREKKGTREMQMETNNPAIWWDKKSATDVRPKWLAYDAAQACTVHSYQGSTIDVVCDIDNMTEHGVLYTAITRSREFPYIITQQ